MLFCQGRFLSNRMRDFSGLSHDSNKNVNGGHDYHEEKLGSSKDLDGKAAILPSIKEENEESGSEHDGP